MLNLLKSFEAGINGGGRYFRVGGGDQFARAADSVRPLCEPKGPYFSDLPGRAMRLLRTKKSYQRGP